VLSGIAWSLAPQLWPPRRTRDSFSRSLTTLEHELNDCDLYVEKRYADVTGSTYNPERTEYAVVARKQ
jgi:hypothetical protein